jgi:hypothetical protein
VCYISCESDVSFDGKEPPPKMVVNSIIHARADSGIIKISESVFGFGNIRASKVEDVDIQLKINGKLVENIVEYIPPSSSRPPIVMSDLHRYYIFKNQLNIGDKIDVSVHSPKHGTVEGYDIIPNIVEIKSLDTEWFTKDNVQYLRLFVSIQDMPTERNFYRVVVKTSSMIFHPSQQEYLNIWVAEDVIIDDEILFHKPIENDEGAKIPNQYRIFTNDLFQGHEYTMNVYIRYDNRENSSHVDYLRQWVKVEIHTLSEKLYLNLRSQELASGSLGDFYLEPVKIYSNIKNGYGIFGTYNSSEKIKLVAQKGDD